MNTDVFCHGVMKTFTWILPDETLDESHFGHVLNWGCCECGESGSVLYGKKHKREIWKAFNIRTDQGKVSTEGYVLGNWAVSPYADEILIHYLPDGSRLPLSFPPEAFDKALRTLRHLYRQLPKVQSDNPDHRRFLHGICSA